MACKRSGVRNPLGSTPTNPQVTHLRVSSLAGLGVGGESAGPYQVHMRPESFGMSLDDIDLDQRIMWVLGKGRWPRALAIGRKTAQALDRYLRAREGHRLAHLPHVWVGRNGPMTLRVSARPGRSVQPGFTPAFVFGPCSQVVQQLAVAGPQALHGLTGAGAQLKDGVRAGG
jgi:hypothetical protein